jgi:cell division protein ZapA
MRVPQLKLEIGARVFEVACEPGQEASLERAARQLDTEAQKVNELIGRSTERQMLLLSGLMLADTTTALEDRLRATEARLRTAEERIRQAEAKAAMLAANALKYETEAAPRAYNPEIEQLRDENTAAAMLIARMIDEINGLAEAVETETESRG